MSRPWSHRGLALLGLATVGALIGGLGVWGAQARLAGAVIATGQVEVEARRQVVQHPDGGVVREILVREGDAVTAGQPLLRLDDSELRSQQRILTAQIDELSARIARLSAERDGAGEVVFPDDLTARAASDPALAEILAGQRNLFAARKATLDSAVRALQEQQVQIDNEISGQKAQSDADALQLDLVSQELADVETLLGKGLVEANRVNALKRENARLIGAQGEIEAAMARNRGRIAQFDTEIIKLEAAHREEAVGDLRDTRTRQAELVERRNAIEARLARLGLTAPMSGIVLGLTVHSLGSVIRPAEPVLYIVPQTQEMMVSARIDVYHIDSIRPGQPANLRFTAFDTRTTPEITAAVLRRSADTLTDERTGGQYYTVELVPTREQLDKLEGRVLVPGMPVEVFIQTGEHTPLQYLLKPFTDYFRHAFRE